MRNWYCLINFPDGTQSIDLVPRPAPVPTTDHALPIVKISGRPGVWQVIDVQVRGRTADYAAEIWVEPAESDN